MRLWLAGSLVLAQPVVAEEAIVATASNFLTPLRALVAQFESGTDHSITIVAGSTGQLYAQITNGAPFDVLLAADQERPRLLAENGIAGETFSYAIGRLAVFTRQPGVEMDEILQRLPATDFRNLAIAEPAIAPYGAAAMQVLERTGISEVLAPKIVSGLNVSQAFAMVATGSAEFGILAYSQVLAWDGEGSYLLLDSSLHDPIVQDAVLLTRAAENPAALEFFDFLRSEAAATIIAAHGYRHGSEPAAGPAPVSR